MTQPTSAASLAARLVGRSGDYQGNEFFIKGDDFAIGRAYFAGVVFGALLSRTHNYQTHT
jgi:hypothetical protein